MQVAHWRTPAATRRCTATTGVSTTRTPTLCAAASKTTSSAAMAPGFTASLLRLAPYQLQRRRARLPSWRRVACGGAFRGHAACRRHTSAGHPLNFPLIWPPCLHRREPPHKKRRQPQRGPRHHLYHLGHSSASSSRSASPRPVPSSAGSRSASPLPSGRGKLPRCSLPSMRSMNHTNPRCAVSTTAMCIH